VMAESEVFNLRLKLKPDSMFSAHASLEKTNVE